MEESVVDERWIRWVSNEVESSTRVVGVALE